MKKYLLLLIILLSPKTQAQELYMQTFGKPADTPVIFLHGGPGYNAAGFEIAAAQPLASRGFFVIVYDRRGEGRSAKINAGYTFTETFADLNSIYEKFHLKSAVLMGHSFGGIVATKFAEQYPLKVSAILLVSAPVSLQETFITIISSSRKIYESKQDTSSLNYLDMLEKMDHSSMEYASYSFMHAMQNGFYMPKKRTPEASEIYDAAKKSSEAKYLSQMTYEAPQGFSKNEKYTTINLSSDLKKLVAAKMKIFGIYGKDDGLYAPEQVSQLAAIIGEKNVAYLDDASHSVFIDQQSQFLSLVANYLK